VRTTTSTESDAQIGQLPNRVGCSCMSWLRFSSALPCCDGRISAQNCVLPAEPSSSQYRVCHSAERPRMRGHEPFAMQLARAALGFAHAPLPVHVASLTGPPPDGPQQVVTARFFSYRRAATCCELSRVTRSKNVSGSKACAHGGRSGSKAQALSRASDTRTRPSGACVT